jgi:hypothetical protein
MRVSADADVGMFGGFVIIPSGFGITVVSHVGNEPPSQSKGSISG